MVDISAVNINAITQPACMLNFPRNRKMLQRDFGVVHSLYNAREKCDSLQCSVASFDSAVAFLARSWCISGNGSLKLFCNAMSHSCRCMFGVALNRVARVVLEMCSDRVPHYHGWTSRPRRLMPGRHPVEVELLSGPVQ